jgi:hypothetical protein
MSTRDTIDIHWGEMSWPTRFALPKPPWVIVASSGSPSTVSTIGRPLA